MWRNAGSMRTASSAEITRRSQPGSQLCGSRLGAVEFLPPGMEVQDALGALDVGDAGVASARAPAPARC
jgi:hypothetical protein